MRTLEQKRLIPEQEEIFIIRRKINSSLPEHKLDCFKMTFFVYGDGTIRVGSKDYLIQNGSFFFFPPFQAHQVKISSTADYFDIALRDNFFEEEENKALAALLPQSDTDGSKTAFYPDPSQQARILSCLNRIICEKNEKAQDYQAMIRTELGILFLLVKRADGIRAASRQFPAKAPLPVLKDYIQQHLCESITLEQIASRYSYAPAYLSRLFKQKEGLTFKQYVKEKRMEYACQLLRDSQWSANEIAAMIGYTNKTVFYRFFKEKYGVTPAVFRKEHRPRY